MSNRPDTRKRLIGAARELFLEQGYAATGVAQILKKAGARSGSLYYFFPTKEDLLLAVLEDYRDLLWPLVIQPVFDRIDDPLERIFGVLDGYRQMLRMTKCTIGCPIGNLALELSGSHPQARKLIAQNFSGWTAAIEQCIVDAADRLPESADAYDLAQFVLTTMEGAVMLSRAYRKIDPFDTAVAQLREYFDLLVAQGTEWSRPRTPE